MTRAVRRKIEAGAQASRLRAEDGVQFDLQDVAFDDFNIGLHGKFHAELRREDAIQFHGDQPPRFPRQQVRDGAAAGPDLQHRCLGNYSPRASTMRSAADSSARKCCPSLGLRGLIWMVAPFGTLTLFLSGI